MRWILALSFLISGCVGESTDESQPADVTGPAGSAIQAEQPAGPSDLDRLDLCARRVAILLLVLPDDGDRIASHFDAEYDALRGRLGTPGDVFQRRIDDAEAHAPDDLAHSESQSTRDVMSGGYDACAQLGIDQAPLVQAVLQFDEQGTL